MNLCAIIRNHAVSQPNKIALECQQEKISYRELWQKIEGCAQILQDNGVKSGDRVGLVLADTSLHLILHYALPRIGAVIVPIDHRWTSAEKTTAADVFKTKLLITEEGEDLPGEAPCININAIPTATDLPDIPEQPAMPLLISLSSGTTGRPKGAIVSHRELYERFVSQWVTIGFNSADRFVAVTPLVFGAGRSFGMAFLSAGGTVILNPPPHSPEELIHAVNSCHASVVFLVPTLLRRLLPLVPKEGLLFPRLRRLLISGAALYADEAGEIIRYVSPNLTGYYASSEGGGISVLSTDEYPDFPGTVGRPTFRTEVEIVDSDGNALPRGETGRLRYRGPGVARQFLDSDGEQEAADPAGWFYPGDLACLSEEGHITLRGRDRDVINRGGINIYPAEIEAVLIRHEAVCEVAVVGQKSETLGEEVSAFVVLTRDTSSDELEAHCRKRLASYKVPSSIMIRDELPKASSGKIDKKRLAESPAD